MSAALFVGDLSEDALGHQVAPLPRGGQAQLPPVHSLGTGVQGYGPPGRLAYLLTSIVPGRPFPLLAYLFGENPQPP
jgi:hypothetical protein